MGKSQQNLCNIMHYVAQSPISWPINHSIYIYWIDLNSSVHPRFIFEYILVGCSTLTLHFWRPTHVRNPPRQRSQTAPARHSQGRLAAWVAWDSRPRCRGTGLPQRPPCRSKKKVRYIQWIGLRDFFFPGNHRLSHEIKYFPVNLPLNQSIDTFPRAQSSTMIERFYNGTGTWFWNFYLHPSGLTILKHLGPDSMQFHDGPNF